jgi:hypothetical protein
MDPCQGVEWWPDGPPCAGDVRAVLVSRTLRLMGRSLERVWVCRAHATHAEAHGFAVLAVEEDAPGGREPGAFRPGRPAAEFPVIKPLARTGY